MLSLHTHFSKPVFERYRSFCRWNGISYEIAKKTALFYAKKQKSQKMRFDHYAPGTFICTPKTVSSIHNLFNEHFLQLGLFSKVFCCVKTDEVEVDCYLKLV